MAQLNLLDANEDAVLPQGNRRLVAYGIQNEVSDYRVHVGFKTGFVFVFPTASGRKALLRVMEGNGAARAVVVKDEATGAEIETARGYAVPLSYIENLSEVIIPRDVLNANPIHKGMTTSEKGMRAAQVVHAMLLRNLIPLPVRVDPTDNKALQVSGTDFLINASLRLQAKCDFRAGSANHGGSGNVFMQVAECNPYKRF